MVRTLSLTLKQKDRFVKTSLIGGSLVRVMKDGTQISFYKVNYLKIRL